MACDSHEGQAATLNRRTLILGTAGTVAAGGLARSLVWPAFAGASEGLGTLPAPKPIPGGLPVPPVPGGTLHAFLPGPEGLTLPFSGLTLQGENVEPSTMTDFQGATGVAMVVGKATGSDGVTYNLEADVRAYKGRYVGADGTHHRGSFAFI